MYYFCTYFDRHYIDKGLALYYSIVRHCSPFQLWVLCMDNATHQILSEMQLPHVRLIALTEFERNDPLLQKAKSNRSLIEYYFTCTPSLPIYVLDNAPEVDIITYLDADMYFFASIEPIYQELGDGSVLVVEHRFPPALKKLEIFGIYNVGLLVFKRDVNGLACLHWWRDCCLEWCYDRLEGSRFADQKYLDDWPERFAGVVVSDHKGIGLAPWNITNYSYSYSCGNFLVDDQYLVVYHFHGLKQVNQWLYDANIASYKARLPKIMKRTLYLSYIKKLRRINQNLQKFEEFDSDQTRSIRASVDEDAPVLMKVINSVKNGIGRLKIFRNLVYNNLILIGQEE